MARLLQSLLGTPEPLFSMGIMKLEQATGRSGVDTRLIADITHKAHNIMRSLGLNPADTTGQELYLALHTSARDRSAEALLLDADFVLLLVDDQVISFNLIDVINNSHLQLPFGEQVVSRGRRSLRGEIVNRYVDHARTDGRAMRDIAKSIGLMPDSDQNYITERKADMPDETTNGAPYILAIGDIVTDAFIALREDQAEVTTDDKGIQRLSMEFGSKPPYDHVDVIQAVGNSANAAVSFTRLGLQAGLLAFLGDDQAGKDSLNYLVSQKVDTDNVSVQAGKKSNYHFALRYGADRTILIKYEDYDYAWREPSRVPEWIYLSMISEASWQLHLDLMSYLETHPGVKLAFQPGTFHFKWGVEKLAQIYGRSDVIMMNREEAGLVTGKGIESIRDLMDGLHALGPKLVIITDGPHGSYASDGGRILVMPNYPDPAPPYDRTGAGDAFASTLVAALALGEPLEVALKWAPINSMSVVQKLGAQAGLLHPDELHTLLEAAPEDYYAKELSE